MTNVDNNVCGSAPVEYMIRDLHHGNKDTP